MAHKRREKRGGIGTILIKNYNKLIDQGQYDKVIELLTPKLEENPSNPEFWDLLALSYFKKNNAKNRSKSSRRD